MTKYAAKRSAVYLLVMAVLLGISAAEDATPEPEPYRVDFIEETGIDLILMDVEVYDKKGRPLHNLKKEDFTLKINGKVRTIYSVDDLCTCSDPAVEEEPAGAIADTAPEPAEQSSPVPSEPMLYVLYLNFGQLQQDGRVHALEEAERWIREVMQPGEQVRIMAWTSRTGLLDLTPVTDNKEELFAALAKAGNNPKLIDPFPDLRWKRKFECSSCYAACEPGDFACPMRCAHNCRMLAKEEYYHGHWSLGALQQLLYRLEQVRGRKTILYFFQNDVLYPSRLFMGVEDRDILDLNPDIEQVGADAVLSRTTIAAAFSGSDPDRLGINVGANLADYSGGSYSRAAYLLPALTSEIGRGCRCIYRIGVQPPATRRKGLYHAKVYVNDKKIPRAFRLQHLSRFDRWLRESQYVLLSPGSATAIPVITSLHPVGLEKGRWNLMVRVAVEAEVLLLLPAAGGKGGSWEAGALLYRQPGTDAKELLANSYLMVESQAVPGLYVVHERTMNGIKPGEWYLSAFVRDQNTKSIGGSESTMILPKPGEAGLSTTVPFRAGQSWIRTGLPDLTRNPKKVTGKIRSGETIQEPLSLHDFPIKRGHDLEFRTWVCSPKKGKGDAVVRFIAREGEPIFRFETVKPPKGGSCIELVDPVETRYLEPGEYVYHIRYSPEGRPEPLAEETMFLLE